MTPPGGSRSRGLREAILRRLEDLPRQYAALQTAMASFGDEFDREAFAAAFSGDDLEAYNRAQAIEQGLTTLQNYVVELAGAGAELAGLRGKARAEVRRDLELLRDAGVISASLAQRLVGLQRVRIALQHAYVDLDPGELHGAVLDLHDAIPPFARALRDWIAPRL